MRSAVVRIVVAAHAPAGGRDAAPGLLAGVPRVGEDEDARATARSSAVRRQAVC